MSPYLEAWCEERIVGVPSQVQVPEDTPAKLLKVGQLGHLVHFVTFQFSLYSIVLVTKMHFLINFQCITTKQLRKIYYQLHHARWVDWMTNAYMCLSLHSSRTFGNSTQLSPIEGCYPRCLPMSFTGCVFGKAEDAKILCSWTGWPDSMLQKKRKAVTHSNAWADPNWYWLVSLRFLH